MRNKLKKIILELYLNISKKLSRGKGYGKKYKIINSTVNKIETSLKSDTADVWAGKMFLHPNDGLRLSIRGVYDERDAMIVKNNIKKDEIVIDLGAHIGYYSLMMAKLVGRDGKVFAFEPELRNLELLRKNILSHDDYLPSVLLILTFVVYFIDLNLNFPSSRPVNQFLLLMFMCLVLNYKEEINEKK